MYVNKIGIYNKEKEKKLIIPEKTTKVRAGLGLHSFEH